MILYFIVLLIMTAMGALASVSLKMATNSKSLLSILFNRYLILGGFLYFIAALLNIWLLYYLDYSVVLPLTSLTYIWTMLIAYFCLKESMSLSKFIGVLLISAGAYLVTL